MSIRKRIIKDFFNSPEMNRDKWLRKGSTFHAEDLRFLKEIIPENSNILELGSGNGQLLAALKPKYGLGIDFSKKLVKEAKELGGNIYPVKCLNTNKNWCKDFAKYTFTQAEGSAQDKEDIEYQLDKKYYQEMPKQEMNKT